jgi:hypothetical protein
MESRMPACGCSCGAMHPRCDAVALAPLGPAVGCARLVVVCNQALVTLSLRSRRSLINTKEMIYDAHY